MAKRTEYLLSLFLLTALVFSSACECTECPPGTDGCPCLDDACAIGLLCKSDKCRAPKKCKDLKCGPRLCQEATTGVDARCLQKCEEGFAWDSQAKRCIQLEANCEPDVNNSILAQCQVLYRNCLTFTSGAACGGCLQGYVDNGVGEDEACLAEATCDDATTQACRDIGRTCANGSCGGCLQGYQSIGEQCLRLHCGMSTEPGAIGTQCAQQSRSCEETASGAQCGDCLPGFIETTGEMGAVCQPSPTCRSLDCAAYHRLCVDGDGATCGDCMAGYREESGNCVALGGMTCDEGDNSLLDACTSENRLCQLSPQGAICGDCADGFVVSPDSAACVTPQDCSNSSCGDIGRRCESLPTAHCAECLEGLVEDGAGCRPPLTCDDLDCGSWNCAPAPQGSLTDARCISPCAGTDLWNGRECVSCPPCDAASELGPEDRPTLAGRCICRTKPGYFYSLANESGTVPCDSDGDGWVRESVRIALESGDPVLAENARCVINKITYIELRNDLGQTRRIPLEEPLPLMESVRNDDDEVLRVQWQADQLPMDYWGPQGEGISASALNRFTKLCHHPRVDYNDNALSDASEWADMEPGEDFRQEYMPFNQYSYFLELHRGWYQASTEETTLGTWIIEERGRALTDGFPLDYPACDETDECSHWRGCLRRQDSLATTAEIPVGMDLALLPETLASGSSWHGMGHHSQFKCLVISDVVEQGNLWQRTASQAQEEFSLNSCQASAAVSHQPGNAAEVTFDCQTTSQPPQSGTALWGAVPYAHYPASSAHAGYTRGCVNDCAQALFAYAKDPQDLSCPGIAANRPLCAADVEDFGKLECLEVMCDGIDNDGDGATDEDAPDPEAYCEVGDEPECCFTGELGLCNLGTVRSCNGEQMECEGRESAEEICDGLDNDCDGDIDEELDGIPCAFESASLGLPPDYLLPGVCGDRVTLCVDGVYDCLPRELASYQPYGETLCDGLDNDCDGDVDEDLEGFAFQGETVGSFGQACVNSGSIQGLCANKTWQCLDGHPSCHPTDLRIVEAETNDVYWMTGAWMCDGLDNDCDGQIDEGDVCLRRTGVWNHEKLVPVALDRHNIFAPNSEAEITLTTQFFAEPLGSEITVRETMTVQEICDGACGDNWIPCESPCNIEFPVPPVQEDPEHSTASYTIPTSGKIRELIGGDNFSITYRDNNDDLDSVISYTGVSGRVISHQPHPAVRTLSCRGLGVGMVTEYPEMFGDKGCDHTLCHKAYELCLDHPTYSTQCVPAYECSLACTGHSCDCDFGAQAENLLRRIDFCCHEYSDHLQGVAYRYFTTSCEADYKIEYTIWPLENLPPTPPTSEICDGYDNDYDGHVDEHFPERGQACGGNEGICEPGTLDCVNGVLVCQGGVEPLEDELPTCNQRDDDCDGDVDEGVRDACVSTCGIGTKGCGHSDSCLGGGCPEFCGTPGYRDCADGAQVYGECFWPEIPEERCNGEDDDCNGQTDESFPEDPEQVDCVDGALVCKALPELAQTCAEYRQACSYAKDGVYTLYHGGVAGNAWQAYCHNMEGQPVEYLQLLAQESSDNFCRYPGGENTPGHLETRYQKVRIDPLTLVVDTTDHTFSTSYGQIEYHQGPAWTSLDYAAAHSCQGADDGTANINLTGTGFRVVETEFTFTTSGMGSVTYSLGAEIVDLTGGGYCGYTKATNDQLQLELVP